MQNNDVMDQGLDSFDNFAASNESEDITIFMNLADDELMLQAVFSRC